MSSLPASRPSTRLSRRNLIRLGAVVTPLLALGAASAIAQGPGKTADAGFPRQTVRLVVPYPAGGIVDINARIVADELSKQWRQPVIVENKPGGNGNIGAEAVRQAKPDGHTLLVGSNFLILNPLIDAATRYRSTDFVPVVQLGSAPAMLTVPASLPVRSVQEFIALAKREPGRFNAASPGVGTVNALTLERFADVAGLKLETVLYQGQPPYMLDLVQNRVQLASVTTTLSAPYLKTGQLRALAVVGESRLEAYPNVPTLKEVGLGEAAVEGLGGLFAPLGTPPEVQASLRDAVAQVFKSPSARERFAAQQIQLPQAAGQFAGRVAQEQQRWARLLAPQSAQR